MSEHDKVQSSDSKTFRGGWFNRHMTCLRERKVSRVAITYSLIVWLIVQIGDVCFPLLEIGESLMLYLVLAAVLGLPVAMLLAWLFEITPDGIVLDRCHHAQAHSEPTELVANTSFLLVAALIAWLMVLRIVGTDPVLADDGVATAEHTAHVEDLRQGTSDFLCVTLGVRDGRVEVTTAQAIGPDSVCSPVRLHDSRLVLIPKSG